MKSLITGALLGGMLVTFAAAAQAETLEVNVPFAFVVGSTQMPAGQYRIDRGPSEAGSVLLIRGEHGNSATLFVQTTPLLGIVDTAVVGQLGDAGAAPIAGGEKLRHLAFDLAYLRAPGRNVSGRKRSSLRKRFHFLAECRQAGALGHVGNADRFDFGLAGGNRRPMAANGDRMVQRIAELGHPWYLNPHAPFTTLERQVAMYKEVWAERGHGPIETLPMSRETFVAESRNKAMQRPSDRRVTATSIASSGSMLVTGQSLPPAITASCVSRARTTSSRMAISSTSVTPRRSADYAD